MYVLSLVHYTLGYGIAYSQSTDHDQGNVVIKKSNNGRFFRQTENLSKTKVCESNNFV